MGGFNPAGTPDTVHHPLGLVTTTQNTFRTMMAGWCVFASEAINVKASNMVLSSQLASREERLLQSNGWKTMAVELTATISAKQSKT